MPTGDNTQTAQTNTQSTNGWGAILDFISSDDTITKLTTNPESVDINFKTLSYSTNSPTLIDCFMMSNQLASNQSKVDMKRNELLSKNTHALEKLNNILEQDKTHNINKNKLLNKKLNYEVNGDDNIKDTEGNKISPSIAKAVYHTEKAIDEKKSNSIDLGSILDKVSDTYDDIFGGDGEGGLMSKVMKGFIPTAEEIKAIDDVTNEGVRLAESSSQKLDKLLPK